MTDDLQARLDRAIAEARTSLSAAIDAEIVAWQRPEDDEIAAYEVTQTEIDRYAALVALRARLDEIGMHVDDCFKPHRRASLTAEAERLLGREDA